MYALVKHSGCVKNVLYFSRKYSELITQFKEDNNIFQWLSGTVKCLNWPVRFVFSEFWIINLNQIANLHICSWWDNEAPNELQDYCEQAENYGNILTKLRKSDHSIRFSRHKNRHFRLRNKKVQWKIFSKLISARWKIFQNKIRRYFGNYDIK